MRCLATRPPQISGQARPGLGAAVSPTRARLDRHLADPARAPPMAGQTQLRTRTVRTDSRNRSAANCCSDRRSTSKLEVIVAVRLSRPVRMLGLL